MAQHLPGRDGQNDDIKCEIRGVRYVATRATAMSMASWKYFRKTAPSAPTWTG
jgi:hypothetical protein